MFDMIGRACEGQMVGAGRGCSRYVLTMGEKGEGDIVMDMDDYGAL